MQTFEFEVIEGQDKLRLDKFLVEQFAAQELTMTRSKVQSLIDDGHVLSDGQVVNASKKTKMGQVFSVEIPAVKPMNLEAKEIEFEIVFEDDDLLVINKPVGLTVHPGAGNQDNTLVNGLLFTHQNRLSSINGEFRPGIVHRLDKDTSGLMLVAKNDFTHNALSEALQLREIKRNYLAFIYGVTTPKWGSIKKNIVRSRVNRLKMTVAKVAGREAITNFETKEIFRGGFASLIECKLQTGRTHQIRVHMESVKHSLIGDQHYSSCRKMMPKEVSDEVRDYIEGFPRQALHSYKISFIHPRSEEEMSFEIGLPDDLKKLKELLING